MSDQAAGPDDGLQDPLVHEGGDTDDVSTNERADGKVTVEQPSGEEAPRAQE
jgi:hypothetical protein